MTFAGLDYSKWTRGFDNNDAIVAYIKSSVYFNDDYFRALKFKGPPRALTGRF